MSTVLEEKVPTIMNSITQPYGTNGQSAAEAVSEGLNKVALGISAHSVDGFQNTAFPTETISVGKFNAINCPTIGSKISEPAAFALTDDPQAKSISVQNPELNAFTKSVFGKNGVQSVIMDVAKVQSERGIIINGNIPRSDDGGFIIQVKNQAQSQNGTEQGIIIHAKPNQAEATNPLVEEAIVAPEYFVFKSMEQTLKTTLSLQDDLFRSKLQFRA